MSNKDPKSLDDVVKELYKGYIKECENAGIEVAPFNVFEVLARRRITEMIADKVADKSTERMQKEGGDALYLVMRVSEMPDPNDGSKIGQCGQCGESVWYDPVISVKAEAMGATPICSVCAQEVMGMSHEDIVTKALKDTYGGE